MTSTLLSSVLMLIICCCSCCHSSNIIFVVPIATKSQMSFTGEIISRLADRGHQITLVTSHAGPKHPNVTEVDLHLPMNKYLPNSFDYRDMQMVYLMERIMPAMCSDVLASEAAQRINFSQYDLVILAALANDHHCFLSTLENLDVPLILSVPTPLDEHQQDVIGNVDFPSFVPINGGSSRTALTFQQRMVGAVSRVYNLYHINTYIDRADSICRERGLCRRDMTPLRVLARRASFVFINSVRSLEVPPRPHVPAVIHLGGLNCRPAKPLPKDLETWMSEAGDSGIIYMSLGTSVKTSDMPERYLRVMLAVFGSLSQRVVFKYDAPNIEDVPSNVRLTQWTPQQDILGHPLLRLFISQGGVYSMLEAAYHGTPVLGLPVMYDQKFNIARVVEEGWGEEVVWEELTFDLLRGKILQMIDDKRYRETAQHRSLLMKDQPISPQQAVVFWTEYAIRHRGAPHLRSPVKDLYWYELYNVDVWLTVAVIVASTAAALVWLLLLALRKLFRAATQRKQKTC